MATLRKQIEDVVREFLRTQTAADQSVLTIPVDGSSSIERQADLDRIAELRAQQVRELTPMREKAQALTAQLATLDTQRAELRKELVATEQQRLSRNCQLSDELDKLDMKVRKTAPPAIDAFIAELDKEASSLRVHGHSLARDIGPRNLFSETLKKPQSFYSDGPSITRRVQAVIDTRRAAEALKVERLTEEQLAQALDQLQAGLPPIVEEELDPWFMRIATASAMRA
jgi:DNA repair exonuclease SbcCD ATPase subunit